MPKTQSALLEAMAERQVTVDGNTRPVPRPFLLLATENPIEYEGTFPLPEAQLDRFFLRTSLGYPSAEEELQVIGDQRIEHPLASLRPVVEVKEIDDAPACGRGRVRRSADRGVDRRPGAGDTRDDRDGRRRLRARQPGARARRARLGAPARARLRRPDRRRAPVRRGARPPRRPHAREARRGAPAGHGRRHRGVRGRVPRASRRRPPRGSRSRRPTRAPSDDRLVAHLSARLPPTADRSCVRLDARRRGEARAPTSPAHARTFRATIPTGSTGRRRRRLSAARGDRRVRRARVLRRRGAEGRRLRRPPPRDVALPARPSVPRTRTPLPRSHSS